MSFNFWTSPSFSSISSLAQFQSDLFDPDLPKGVRRSGLGSQESRGISSYREEREREAKGTQASVPLTRKPHNSNLEYLFPLEISKP